MDDNNTDKVVVLAANNLVGALRGTETNGSNRATSESTVKKAFSRGRDILQDKNIHITGKAAEDDSEEARKGLHWSGGGLILFQSFALTMANNDRLTF